MLDAMARAAGIARSLTIYYGKPVRQAHQCRLYRAFVRPGDLCFDIGAHVGSRTRSLARLGATVVAVEPQPDFARLLCLLYGRRADIAIVQSAVGAEVGEGALHISRRTPTVSTLSRDWIEAVQGDPGFAGVAWDQSVATPVTTLDALIAEHGLPAFCKIDVEGHEAEILRGLSKPIACLSFEYTPSAPSVALSCIDLLTALGPYRFNVTVGETLRWARSDWMDADDLRRWLRARSKGEQSGDVYANLPP